MTNWKSAQPLRRWVIEMRRRELMLLLGGAMTVGPDLRAQEKAMPVIGWLSIGSPGVRQGYPFDCLPPGPE